MNINARIVDYIHSAGMHSPEMARMRRVRTENLEGARRAMTKPRKLLGGEVGVAGKQPGSCLVVGIHEEEKAWLFLMETATPRIWLSNQISPRWRLEILLGSRFFNCGHLLI